MQYGCVFLRKYQTTFKNFKYINMHKLIRFEEKNGTVNAYFTYKGTLKNRHLEVTHCMWDNTLDRNCMQFPKYQWKNKAIA